MEEWAVISESNIVWIVYGPEKYSVLKIKSDIKAFVSSHRFDFLAKLGYYVAYYAYHARVQCVNTHNVGCLKNINQVSLVGYR